MCVWFICRGVGASKSRLRGASEGRVKGCCCKDINTKIARKADTATTTTTTRTTLPTSNCIYISIYDSIKMSHLPLAPPTPAVLFSFTLTWTLFTENFLIVFTHSWVLCRPLFIFPINLCLGASFKSSFCS